MSELKERPILFSGPMVRAILDGRKTQTRRVVKPQPYAGWMPSHYCELHRMKCGEFLLSGGEPIPIGWGAVNASGEDGYVCPYGSPGDRLWVRETWAGAVEGCQTQGGVSYRADHIDPQGDGPAHPMRWRPSIHMPRRASRLTLEITGVRVERLQDISDSDAFAEGLQHWVDENRGRTGDGSVRGAFLAMWSSINGPISRAVNPWVWVLEFQVDA